MLNFLPDIYPDELWGSVIARTFAYSGYVTCKSFAQDIFKGKQECLNNVFINSYQRAFISLINKVYGAKTVVGHTLIPFYLLTSGPNKKPLYSKALKYDRSVNKNLATPKNINCHLKYCELCRREEIEQHGEPYWHISHQTLNYCPKHCCKLVLSSIQYTKSKSYSFVPLSSILESESPIVYKDMNDINVLFDRYVTKVLEEPITFESGQISDYLRSVIPDCYYMDIQRERIDSKKLFIDIKNFYKDLDNVDGLTAYRIRSILNSTQINVRDYLLIAYFLGLSPKEASRAKAIIKENETVNKVISLYKSKNSIHYVSRIMRIDRKIIRRTLKKYLGQY